MEAKYDIEKALEDVSKRMHGTNFEQDRIIVLDAIELIRYLQKKTGRKEEEK